MRFILQFILSLNPQERDESCGPVQWVLLCHSLARLLQEWRQFGTVRRSPVRACIVKWQLPKWTFHCNEPYSTPVGAFRLHCCIPILSSARIGPKSDVSKLTFFCFLLWHWINQARIMQFPALLWWLCCSPSCPALTLTEGSKGNFLFLPIANRMCQLLSFANVAINSWLWAPASGKQIMLIWTLLLAVSRAPWRWAVPPGWGEVGKGFWYRSLRC